MHTQQVFPSALPSWLRTPPSCVSIPLIIVANSSLALSEAAAVGAGEPNASSFPSDSFSAAVSDVLSAACLFSDDDMRRSVALAVRQNFSSRASIRSFKNCTSRSRATFSVSACASRAFWSATSTATCASASRFACACKFIRWTSSCIASVSAAATRSSSLLRLRRCSCSVETCFIRHASRDSCNTRSRATNMPIASGCAGAVSVSEAL
mmetsp:Transcript_17401/g.31731  ORF Transcript_17401/g.31731 Transcript_17401/m.31731 type:complete len:209 (+) Transcript_17401:617-1243(+)